MNLRRLEYFVTLAQTGNLRKAAELSNISAPALSKAMRVLEDELEVSLWVRDGRRIIMTDSGKALLKKAPQLMNDLKNLRESLLKTSEVSTNVRIGTFEVFSTYFLSFMNSLKWNEHQLELHELLPGEVERYVAQGDIDYGITYMPVSIPDVDFIKAAKIEMGVFTRTGSFKGVAQTDLPFVVPILPLQGVPTKVRGLDGWPEDAYRRNILHQVTLLESALELCRQGRCAGYFPVFIAEAHNRQVKAQFALERRPTPFPGRTCFADVYIVKRKSTPENGVVRQLAKALRALS